MKMNKREIGFKYEEIAKSYLTLMGLTHIKSNFYTKYGEIDLIFLEEQVLVFVEVKYRKNNKYGETLEMINERKQKKIKMASDIFVSKIKWKNSIRFDVIGISNKFGKNSINWIKNAF